MKSTTVNTKRGMVSYYTMSGVNQGMLTFCVKFEDNVSECNFLLPEEEMTLKEKDRAVILFTEGYEQGRIRGRWEKSKRLGELFNALKCEALGV